MTILINVLSLTYSMNATIFYTNGTSVSQLYFDRSNTTFQNNHYGSNSYMDFNPTNNDVYVRVCYENLSTTQKLDLIYLSENRSLFSSILNYLPLVQNITNNCSNIDVDISSKYAIYPGYIYPVLIPNTSNYSKNNYSLNNSVLFSRLNVFLNGSYELGIDVEGPPKVYLISVKHIYDHNHSEIQRQGPFLVTSVVNSSNSTIAESILSPNTHLTYTGSFVGGEQVFVNGIRSLEIINYEPCTEINRSGYYLMNESVWNRNTSCINITGKENVVLNFGDEIIDGDNSENGSLANNTCSVIIQNSNNITLENFVSQQFYYGLCIINSTVKVFGTGSMYNFHGAFISQNSSVVFSDVNFKDNNQSEIISNESTTTLENVNITTAKIKTVFQNLKMTSVINPPDPPDISGLKSINQYVQFISLNSDPNARLSFYYQEPLPNDVVVDNISIYKYHGQYGYYCNETRTNTSGNTTTNYTIQTLCWEPTNWTKELTYVSPSEQLIMIPNEITNFSVFAPFGFETTNTQPEPTPTPTPKPSSGSSSGGGSTPSIPYTEQVEVSSNTNETIMLDLQIPKEITLMQGQAGDIKFNITNIGKIDAHGVFVKPSVLKGWDYTNGTVGTLNVDENYSGSFQIAPYIKQVPGDYIIPVIAYINNNSNYSVTTRLLKVKVIPRGNLQRIRILEYPPEINVEPFSTQPISFYVKNIGDTNLENITIELPNSPCILDIKGHNSLKYDEEKSIKYMFYFGDKNTCKVNLKFYNNNELIGFLPLTINIKKQFTSWTKQPVKASIMIIIIFAWTILTVHIISKRKNK